MDTFTVIALYIDNDQPFATTVEAEDYESAARMAEAQAESDIIVAGVIRGEHEVR